MDLTLSQAVIKISLDLVPLGILAAEKLGSIEIRNLANHSNRKYRGNYEAKIFTKTGKLKATVLVYDFPRKSKDVFCLLSLIMEQYQIDKKKKKNHKTHL